MIREAKGQDVPVIIEMVKALHESTRMAIPIEEAVVRTTLQRLVLSPSGLLIVSGDAPEAFLAASVGYTSVSSAPIAHEHGWWASPEAKGAGARLLLRYEKWASEQGCQYIRMSTPPHNDRAAFLLERRGFAVSELAWVKAI